jgi:DNA-binding transcriptional regulator YiaG
VEDWEQGRRTPDPLAITLLEQLEQSQKTSRKKSRNPK